MNPSQYAEFQTEQDLLNCGLSKDSIDAIKSTSVVTHNGAQHVVPESQTGRFEHTEVRGSEQMASQESSSQSHESYLRMQLDDQQKMFSRFKNHSEQRIATLEKGLNEAIKELNDMKQQVETLKSNQRAQLRAQETAAQNTAQQSQRSQSNQHNDAQSTGSDVQDSGQQQSAEQQNNKNDEPIDRNKTAPSDVQVESIFYCGYQ